MNVNITYVAGSFTSLSLSLSFSSTIATTTALINLSPSPTPRVFSLYFPFTPSTPSYLFLNRPNSILAFSLSTPNPPTINQSAFLPSLPHGIPRREYEKILLIMCNFFFLFVLYTYIHISDICTHTWDSGYPFLNIS